MDRVVSTYYIRVLEETRKRRERDKTNKSLKVYKGTVPYIQPGGIYPTLDGFKDRGGTDDVTKN